MTGFSYIRVEVHKVLVKLKRRFDCMNESLKGLLVNMEPRQRILGVAVVATLIVAAVNFFLTPGTSVKGEQVTQALPVKNKMPSQPVMPQGYRAEAVVKDPFAIPGEYQKKDDQAVSSMNAAANYLQDKPQFGGSNDSKPLPSLTGIVGGAAKQLAIIEYKTESRAYQVNDVIGPYLVSAIDEHSVVLAGPSGKLTLTLGR